MLLDAATGRAGRAERLARASGSAKPGVGRWNLDLGDVDPLLSAAGGGEAPVEVELPRFDDRDGAAGAMRRGVPVRRVGGHLVTTVFDLLLAQYGVARDGLPGDWPAGYDDPAAPVHAGLAGADHRRRRRRPRPASPGSSPPTPRSPAAGR